MESEQFVTVPSVNLKEKGLKLKDLVVYAYLKKYYDRATHTAFPSLQKLSEDIGMAINTVSKSIDRLEKADYIKVFKSKNVNRYSFSEVNKFEIFSYDFLKDTNTTINEKGYLIAMQSMMYKNSEYGIGKVTFTDLDLASKLQIDYRTLKIYENKLQLGNKPILTIIPTSKIDPNTGLAVNERIFDFGAFSNLLALKFQQVDMKVENLEDKVNASQKDYQMLLQRVQQLEKQINSKEVIPINL